MKLKVWSSQIYKHIPGPFKGTKLLFVLRTKNILRKKKQSEAQQSPFVCAGQMVKWKPHHVEKVKIDQKSSCSELYPTVECQRPPEFTWGTCFLILPTMTHIDEFALKKWKDGAIPFMSEQWALWVTMRPHTYTISFKLLEYGGIWLL